VQPDPPRLQARASIVSIENARERDGTSTIRVTLGVPAGATGRGNARGHPLPESLMRAGARAAIAALSDLMADEVTVELRGAKAVRAFDALVVIASVRVSDPEGRRDLIGAVRAPGGDPVRGGVLAALDAVNRFLAERLADLHPDPRSRPTTPSEAQPPD
jgi:hypothetical protein